MRAAAFLYKIISHTEPTEAPAAAAAVAQQIQQDHAPAPAQKPAGLGVGGLGAVGLAGVLHPAQMHLVLGVVRVQLHGAAGILQSVHAFAKPLIGQRGEIVPPRVAAGHAVQHPARFGVAAAGHKVAGGLHFRGVGAGSAGPGLLVAAKAKTKAKGVEALKPVKAVKTGIAVVLLAVALLPIALAVIALLLVAAVGVAAHLGAGIFFGAVTDFGALYASVKNDGKSMGMLIEKYIGKTGRKLFLLFCWLFCGIVIAAFADMVAGTFNAFGADGAMVEAAKTNGAAGMVSIMFMVFAVVFGLLQKKFNFSGWKESVISIVFIVLSFVIGANLPLILGKAAWSYITFVYIFFAAVLPMWLLKQPRDHMTTFMFVAMIVGAVVGLLVAHPTMNLPVFTGFTNEKLGTMFPILFVTVACGAVSGFHSLVSSGTSSKTVENEKDMLKVGYGAMILESLLAVLALCVAGAAAAADGTPAAGTPFQIFSRGVAGFFEMFGVPAYAATVFMTMCVSALALTSLDAVARIGRMSFQELFSVDDMEHAEGWRKLFCNVYFSTFITLVFGFILTKIGYANIWPLFGSANQLLSALVLATLCVFLKVTGRSNKMLFPPLIIMLCVTFTALVQRLIAMVKAISTAASVTIPAGETTWGAVFIANGLQLILAVLLIVLGLNIVFHSFSAYKKAEHNSEAKV